MNVSLRPYSPPAALAEKRLEQCLGQMLEGQLSGGEKRVVRRAFEALGEENVDKLVEGGIKLKMPDPYATDGVSYQAAYFPSKKTLMLASSRFDKDTLVHEFGHALDDLAEPDVKGKAVLRSEVDSQVKELHQSYCERVSQASWWDKLLGHVQWSDYATTNPQEYLAEGVRKFAGSQRAHDQLAHQDPKLTSYLEGFLHPLA